MTAFHVRRDKAALFQWVQAPPGDPSSRKRPWCVLSFEAVALLRNKGYRARRLEDGFPMENGRAPGQLDAVTATLADLPTAKEARGNERGKRQI